MHHDTCVTHVPWCMSGSLTRGDGENVPGIPGACAPAILRIWQEAHGVWGHGWPTCLLYGCPFWVYVFKMRVGVWIWNNGCEFSTDFCARSPELFFLIACLGFLCGVPGARPDCVFVRRQQGYSYMYLLLLTHGSVCLSCVTRPSQYHSVYLYKEKYYHVGNTVSESFLAWEAD